MSISLDQTDLDILAEIQTRADMSNSDLAKKVGMAPSAMLERVRKLQQKGVIEGFTTRIKPEALDLKLLAFVFIRANEVFGSLSVAKNLMKIPEILELHHIAGEDCYLAKIRARDPQSLAVLMREKFAKISGVVTTKTTIVLETLKETNFLPVPKKP